VANHVILERDPFHGELVVWCDRCNRLTALGQVFCCWWAGTMFARYFQRVIAA